MTAEVYWYRKVQQIDVLPPRGCTDDIAIKACGQHVSIAPGVYDCALIINGARNEVFADGASFRDLRIIGANNTVDGASFATCDIQGAGNDVRGCSFTGTLRITGSDNLVRRCWVIFDDN